MTLPVEIIKTVQDRHPYKQAGNRDSYSSYNEGWSDACDDCEQAVNGYLQSQPQPSDDLLKEMQEEIETTVSTYSNLDGIKDCDKAANGCAVIAQRHIDAAKRDYEEVLQDNRRLT